MNTLHIYEGDCPDELDPGARDPSCPACQELLAIESSINSAQFYEAIQEQHPELVPVIDHNKSAAFDAVLQKCRELGMADNYNVPVIDNVLQFIESLAEMKKT